MSLFVLALSVALLCAACRPEPDDAHSTHSTDTQASYPHVPINGWMQLTRGGARWDFGSTIGEYSHNPWFAAAGKFRDPYPWARIELFPDEPCLVLVNGEPVNVVTEDIGERILMNVGDEQIRMRRDVFDEETIEYWWYATEDERDPATLNIPGSPVGSELAEETTPIPEPLPGAEQAMAFLDELYTTGSASIEIPPPAEVPSMLLTDSAFYAGDDLVYVVCQFEENGGISFDLREFGWQPGDFIANLRLERKSVTIMHPSFGGDWSLQVNEGYVIAHFRE